jgi:SulP family sulfate permease
VHSQQVRKELQDTRLLFAIGKGNVKDTFEEALERARIISESL